MSEEHQHNYAFPPGSLYRHPSEVAYALRTSSSASRHAQPHLPFLVTGYSVPCERHIQRNEDSFLIDQASGMLAVFDGVGGSAAGEIASQTARRSALQRWKQRLREFNKHYYTRQPLAMCANTDLDKSLQQLIEYTDESVRTEGAQQAGTTDLATTVAMAALCRSKNGLRMFYAHVGDSRIYLLPERGPLRRLTTDDGLLGRLVENQMMSEDDARRIDQAMHTSELNELELSYFRHRGGITQALGGPLRPVIHVDQTDITVGDRVLLCTDGIHDNLTDQEIENILRHTPRDRAAFYLVEHSQIRSRQERLVTIRAKPDDMTAVVMTRIY